MTLPASLTAALGHADHMDALSTEADRPLLPFIEDLLAFQPPWLTALYHLRRVLLGLAGHRTGVPPRGTRSRVPTRPGEQAAFFTVEDAGPTHWLAGATEAHLTARLAVLQTPGTARRYRYRVVTVVQYHNRLGRVYFALIQPFHELVVRAMLRRAARSAS